jgi:hypothetical protein
MGRDNFFFIIHLIFKVMVAARELGRKMQGGLIEHTKRLPCRSDFHND